MSWAVVFAARLTSISSEESRPPVCSAESEQRRTYAEDAYPYERLPEMQAAQMALFRRKVPVLRRLLARRGRFLEVGSFV